MRAAGMVAARHACILRGRHAGGMCCFTICILLCVRCVHRPLPARRARDGACGIELRASGRSTSRHSSSRRGIALGCHCTLPRGCSHCTGGPIRPLPSSCLPVPVSGALHFTAPRGELARQWAWKRTRGIVAAGGDRIRWEVASCRLALSQTVRFRMLRARGAAGAQSHTAK
jgi:hypothetical protein